MQVIKLDIRRIARDLTETFMPVDVRCSPEEREVVLETVKLALADKAKLVSFTTGGEDTAEKLKARRRIKEPGKKGKKAVWRYEEVEPVLEDVFCAKLQLLTEEGDTHHLDGAKFKPVVRVQFQDGTVRVVEVPPRVLKKLDPEPPEQTGDDKGGEGSGEKDK